MFDVNNKTSKEKFELFSIRTRTQILDDALAMLFTSDASTECGNVSTMLKSLYRIAGDRNIVFSNSYFVLNDLAYPNWLA